mmetsp:Transcript_10017/g.16475  ORF Transcript_10017/g.16475 Transcript_10017/m.16475 type:complete len:85 (+) Transcript_10017:1217-1471(+)
MLSNTVIAGSCCKYSGTNTKIRAKARNGSTLENNDLTCLRDDLGPVIVAAVSVKDVYTIVSPNERSSVRTIKEGKNRTSNPLFR